METVTNDKNRLFQKTQLHGKNKFDLEDKHGN